MTSDEPTPIAQGEEELRAHRGLFLFSGFLSVALGAVAIIAPHIATLAAEMFIGVLLTIAGVAGAVAAFRARGIAASAGGLLAALVVLVAGVLLLVFPIAGLFSVTIFLAVYFLVSGVAKIYYGLNRPSGAGKIWMTLAGLVSILLALVLLLALPEAAFWALGLIVGIDLVFYGMTLIGAVWSTGRATPTGEG